MRSPDSEVSLTFATDFIRSPNRSALLDEFNRTHAIEAFLVFIPDPDLKVLLAAPGFPQTVPGGIAWKEFLRKCAGRGEWKGELPWPDKTKLHAAQGVALHGYVMVLLGDQFRPELLRELKVMLPLLGAALAGERAILARGAQAEIAAQAAKEAHALATSLDEARRAAQREAAARGKAERELQRKLTEQLLAEEALRQARDELTRMNHELDARVQERTTSLQEAVAQMEEFSYSVSHDLRAPLRAMNAYAGALLEEHGATLEKTARDYLERIIKGSERMEQLTYGMLSYSRVAQRDIEVSKIDLEDLFRDLISQYQEFQPPTAEILVETPLHSVRGHRLSLGQAVTNLLTNAVKFVPPNIPPRIRVSTEKRDQVVRLNIQDNGIGIEPKYQERLFRVFERIHPSNTFEGTGIGLAIVRKAVEKMGGKVGVHSTGRDGSCFWIELPEA